MTANEKLAERLDKAISEGCSCADCTKMRVQEIIASLRSPSPAQGTVLPEAITNELIIKSQFGLMIRGFNGMGFDARLGDVLTDVQLTPQAALDALAKQLDAGGKP